MNKTLLLIFTLSMAMTSCNTSNKQQGTAEMPAVCELEKAAICRTLDQYIEGSRKGNSQITATAFAPGATLAGIYQGKFMLVPIQVLYNLVDQDGAKEANYSLRTCDIQHGIAIVSINAQFGTKQYTDMFTLVKEDNSWKTVSKVYHAHQ